MFNIFIVALINLKKPNGEDIKLTIIRIHRLYKDNF